MLERYFHLTSLRTDVRTEVVAGVTTFLTMSYIIFVQPTVLGAAGMDFGAVLVATCLASAIATLMMGLTANYPIAVAPAMGHNFFFAYTVVVAMHVPWRVALGAVAIAGAIFVATAGIGLREKLITAIPDALKHAIAVGIGLLVALIGLEWGGLVVASPGTLVTLGSVRSPTALLTMFGLLVTAVLMARRVPGALLAGILSSTIAGLISGLVTYRGLFSVPPSLAPTLLQLDIAGALTPAMVPVVVVFFFLALFDSIGTLVGVAGQAGLMRGGSLPRARQALLSDAVGTIAGACLGTSTVTAYIESSTGVAAGGRTAGQRRHRRTVRRLDFPVPAGADDRRRLCRRRRDGALPGRRAGADPGRDDDDRRNSPHRLGRSRRGDPRLPDHRPDPADRQHHRRHRLRVHRVCGAAAWHRTGARHTLAGLPVRGAVPAALRVAVEMTWAGTA